MKKISNLNRKWALLALLALAFGFRFYFGLHCPSMIEDDDEIQTYLIGLKSYTTHTWPFFGPDVGGGAFQTQVPGALEGLLIASSLKIWPVPESPYFFLNLLTFSGFTFLAWYCCKRLPGFPPWMIFTWIYVAPWDTHFSTQVINTSFSIFGAIIFFIGFMETIPGIGIGVLPMGLADVLMGFGFFWVMQLHMSWVMFVPFLTVSIYFQFRSGDWKRIVLYGALGALPLLVLLIPTYLYYGFRTGHDIQGFAAALTWSRMEGCLVVLPRFLSFASFELPRFIGEHTHDRLAYLLDSPWLTVPGFFLWAVGLLQPLFLLAFWFYRRHSRTDWKTIKFFVLGMYLVLFISFWFSARTPSSHRFYESLPVVMIYSFYVWDMLIARPLWRIFIVFFLAASVYFQVGYAVKTDRDGISVYSQYKGRMEKAINMGDYRLLAERRSYAIY